MNCDSHYLWWHNSWFLGIPCHCSVANSCPALCNLMDYSTPGFSVLYYCPEFAQTYVHWVCDAIQHIQTWGVAILATPHLIFYHLILYQPLLQPSIFPSIRVFSNGLALHIRCLSIGVSASASVVPMNIQGWFPLGLTGLISLLSKGLWRVFSSTTMQKHQFFSTQCGANLNSYVITGKKNT